MQKGLHKLDKYPVSFDKANIKCVIFDFDNTMYYSDSQLESKLAWLKNAIVQLGGKTHEEAEALMQRTGFTVYNKHQPSFSSHLALFGITMEQWQNYQSETRYFVDNVQVLPNDYYIALKKKYPLYIVTNSFVHDINIKAEKYGINLAPFKVYGCEHGKQHINKKETYARISKELNLDTSELLIIGDRLKIDIFPMLEQGGKGILVANTDELKLAVEELLA